jgi:TRAP-type C4-dicarboxylate transport system substrate-binding protein
MTIRTVAICALTAVAIALPASTKIVSAAETQYLRIATLAPRDSELARGFVKLDQGLRRATDSSWGVRLYPSGVAGDEVDVLRKMKVGQIDASLITSIGLSQIVHETTLLSTLGVIESYKGWETVRGAMSAEWEAAFDKAGFALLGWGEGGQLRMFANAPLSRPSAVKSMRPWVWPSAWAMKETWSVLGATGVPLGVPEVYGALQTGMVDVVLNSCVALVSLQWHTHLKYMTRDTNAVLVSAMLMSDAKWKQIPEDVRRVVREEIARNSAVDVADIRKADERSCRNLLKRGYSENAWTGEARKEADAMMDSVQKRLVGRMYTAERLARVKLLAHGG